MAIYHFNARGIAPASGSSAVLSAAYQSGQALLCERTGELARYARAERVAASGIELPPKAPAWASDRARLWNEAEAAWGGGKALVARRYILALPRELDADERRALVVDYARRLAAKGYAADWAIHDNGDGNPHAHVLRSALALGEGGFIPAAKEPKTMKRYLVENAEGERRSVSKQEWAEAKAEGWAKVYNYSDGERYTKAAAEKRGLTNADRKGRDAVAVTVTADGGLAIEAEKSDLVAERAAFAALQNAALAAHAARTGGRAATVSHLSYEARGIDRIPTVHEGRAVREMEARASASARAEGRAYEPVTWTRRENVERRRLNDAVRNAAAKVREAAAAVGAWWSRKADAATQARKRAIEAARSFARLAFDRKRSEAAAAERAEAARAVERTPAPAQTAPQAPAAQAPVPPEAIRVMPDDHLLLESEALGYKMQATDAWIAAASAQTYAQAEPHLAKLREALASLMREDAISAEAASAALESASAAQRARTMAAVGLKGAMDAQRRRQRQEPDGQDRGGWKKGR